MHSGLKNAVEKTAEEKGIKLKDYQKTYIRQVERELDDGKIKSEEEAMEMISKKVDLEAEVKKENE